MNNVRNYTDKELLDKAASLQSFNGFPDEYWILGVQSNEDKFNVFDDKFYLFKGERFVLTTSGTTNAGKTAVMGYEKYNKKGVAVIKTNEWYQGLWRNGLHKGRMDALRQITPIKHYRDNNKNTVIEEIGKVYNSIIYCNFHTNSYSKTTTLIRSLIGGWSACCQVCNSPANYRRIITLTQNQASVTYCLLKEF
jgi:hypothetical protein